MHSFPGLTAQKKPLRRNPAKEARKRRHSQKDSGKNRSLAPREGARQSVRSALPMPGSFRQRSGRFSDLRARLRLRYGNDGCDGFSPNFPLILFAEPDCLFDCDNIISSTGFPVKCFFRKSVPVSVLLSDASADYPAAEAVTEGLVAEVGLAPVVQADCVDKAGSAGFGGGQHRPRPGAVPEAQLEVPHG